MLLVPIVLYRHIFASTLNVTEEKPRAVSLFPPFQKGSWAQTTGLTDSRADRFKHGLSDQLLMDVYATTHCSFKHASAKPSHDDKRNSIKEGLKLKDFFSLGRTKSGLFFLLFFFFFFFQPMKFCASFFPKGDTSLLGFLTNNRWATVHRHLGMINLDVHIKSQGK